MITNWTQVCRRLDHLIEELHALTQAIHGIEDAGCMEDVTQMTMTIKKLVASFFHMPVKVLESRTNRAEFHVWPRFIAWTLMREFTSLSYNEIASHFENRDHGSILGGIKRMHERLEANPKDRFSIAFHKIKQIIEQQQSCQTHNTTSPLPVPTPSRSSVTSTVTLGTCGATDSKARLISKSP